MPIAQCFIQPECEASHTDLVKAWATEAGLPPDQMTITLVKSQAQMGKKYSIIATLHLPSLWSSENIDSLQLGLAKALADCFSLVKKEVFVITHIIEPGRVVENGAIVHW